MREPGDRTMIRLPEECKENLAIYTTEYDEATMQKMQQRKSEEDEKKKLLLDLKGKEDVTLDGHKLMLYANIGNAKDLALVLKNDANGIGLFRSEFIYLESKDYHRRLVFTDFSSYTRNIS